jgi:hypothetical protein
MPVVEYTQGLEEGAATAHLFSVFSLPPIAYIHPSFFILMKRFSLLLALVLFVSFSFGQVKSPEQFLGYKLGERYTPHFNVVNYFRQVAETAPAMVKLEQYGKTNEGRPLLLAFVSSAENISNLENIRKNNLRLAGNNPDKATASEQAPAIVWLSYNVHGNETSSSEASMLMIWELVNPANAKSKEYLKNTVVVIDPCINPDGRDRYVNWFNSVVGKTANPQPFVREHVEPWPGGRPNHYYFDLNRDWAWQTQVETQQRIVRYNEWLPHVHVDFHEQGYNQPYYFAPAAEPFHEVITPWQREFQTMIGRNNAKYFDANGWLFFTKERFDLFYPSYGDTYPTYKGAIGMTYEQGGHSRGGAAVINEDGDTLTLYDRLFHHFTTGMSTVEITSMNAAKVVREFKTYYDKARTSPGGDFKAYILKADEGDRLERLKKLLDRNGIEWSYTNAATYTGFNYANSKQESFKTVGRDIVINANQSNSNLVKVLFERNSKISDSATYDITAWSMPFVFGVSTYGLPAYVTNTTKTAPAAITSPTTNTPSASAFAINWNGLSSAKVLAGLLKKGVRVRYSETAFTSQGINFDKGTLIVTRTSNSNFAGRLEDMVREAAQAGGQIYHPLQSGFVDKGYDFGSDRIRIINAPKITLLAGDGVSSLGMGEIWHFFDTQLEYPINIVWSNDLNKNVLKNTDVLILADGNYRFLNDKTMNETLKEWVSNGGKIIAMENAVAQMSRNDWGFKLKLADDKDKKDEKKEDYSLLRRYEDRERDFLPNFNPGSIYKTDLDNSHPLAFGFPDHYYTLKQDDNVYEFLKEGGWNVGVIKKDAQVSGFVGSKLKDKMKDGVLFGVQDMGRGSVVFLADNPLFRSFWENGKLLFCNAVFLVGQ